MPVTRQASNVGEKFKKGMTSVQSIVQLAPKITLSVFIKN